MRPRQWSHVDLDGDGDQDLIGVGDWSDYGRDNAYAEDGNWTNGPLHGYVYRVQNRGSGQQPNYGDPVKVPAGGEPIDIYGMPSTSYSDFDGDGGLDLITGEFRDRFSEPHAHMRVLE